MVMQAPATHASEAGVREAIRLVARVERESGLLSSVSPSQRPFRVHGTVAIADGSTPTAGVSGTAAGLPLEVPVAGPTVGGDLPPVGADLIRLGRADFVFRVRAFYPSAGVTLGIHGHLRPWPARSRLLHGFRVLQRLQDHDGFVVPRPLDSGRGLRHAWVLESLIGGEAIPEHEWPAYIPGVFESLTTMWRSAGVDLLPLASVLPPDALRRLGNLLEQEYDELDTSRAQLLRQVQKLISNSGDVLVGWCHSDPVRTNVIRLADGRLGLVDWEAATRRPLGYGGSKAIIELDDPWPAVEASASMVERLHVRRALSWPDQLAVGCVTRLARMSRKFARTQRSQDAGFRLSVEEDMHANVRLLWRLVSRG